MLVACAWRRVDQQVVCGAPVDVGKELPDHGGFFGTAPDDGVAAVAEEEAEGDAAEGAFFFLLLGLWLLVWLLVLFLCAGRGGG